MKFSMVLILIWAAGPVESAELLSADLYRTAEVRAAFLSRMVGARPMGMGGAFTAVADDASAVSWNPGGLAQLDSLNLLATHEVMGEDMGLSYAAAALPLGWSVIGGSLTALSFGSYDLRDDVGSKIGTEKLTDVAVSAAWAIRNPAWLGAAGGIGVAVEMVKETESPPLLGVTAGGIISAGSQMTLGWAVEHLGPEKDGFALPARVRAGGALRTPLASFVADGAYGLINRQFTMAVGSELTPHPHLALRLGYKWWAQDQGLNGLTGLTAGMGIRLGTLGLDYSYQPFGDMAISHRVALVYGGGV